VTRNDPIYLDANATTPLHPTVVEVMRPWVSEEFGNPSSSHPAGRRAAQAVNNARGQVAALLNARPEEIVFTGGGSEANNLALKGVAWGRRERGRHLIISGVEHPAVREPSRFLEREGWAVSVLPVDGCGRVDPQDVADALRPDTVLVSVMHANNETGSLNPLAEVATLCRERGVLVHTDAAQSVGKIPVNTEGLEVDLVTLAGHKLHGPKGVGALYVRDGLELEPLIHGAGHEQGRRAGTENVAGVVGLGAACRWAHTEGLVTYAEAVRERRDRIHELLAAALPGLALNGHPEERLPNTLNVSIPGVLGREVLAACPEVAASTGSACHEDADYPSEVLMAMGLSKDRALGSMRLSLSLLTGDEDVERAAAALAAAARSVGFQP